MKTSFIVLILVLLTSAVGFAQDPVTILDFSWQRARQIAKKVVDQDVSPARAMTADDKNFRRNVIEQQTKSTMDARENTVDARREALDKIVADSRTPTPGDVNGYSYLVKMKNDSGKKIEIIFWEYRFTELGHPTNVVHRQFLCSANIRPGDSRELSVFSLLGPSDVISAEDLAKATDKLFDEKVLVNRIEYADGTLRQRGNWKYEDFQKAIERVASTPWGKEVCRSF